MPTFRIDDHELSVPDGTTVLQAALANGIEIPHYCYHPGLSIAGNCRICLVEIEKFPKPAIACNTVVSEGMVVHSNTPSVAKLREGVMEFLLINHPLDCPICDQAGECKLQDYAFRFGRPTTRFTEEKVHGPKRRELGPHIVFDWERCIKCTRCIRFCEEVAGTGELGMFLRGVREEVGIFPGRPLENPYSGNTVDLCPVGALTLREFRFRSRVWFLTNVPSVCPGCARGCSIDLGVFRNQVFRITPRENQAINRWWICDEGRLWGQRLAAAEPRRLERPKGFGTGSADPWEAALGEAAGALAAAAQAGRVRVLASPRATLEEVWALAQIAGGPLGGAPIHLPVHQDGADDQLLIRCDRTPNHRGAELVLAAMAGGARPISELEQALSARTVDAVLALGPGLVGPVEDEPPAVEPEAFGQAKHRIVIDAFPSALSGAATVLLPAMAFGETSGSYVNFSGRVQRAERALMPKVESRPAALILGALMEKLGGGPLPAPSRISELLGADIPALAGIDFKALPASTGQNIAGVEAEREACPATGAALRLLAVGVRPAGG